METVSTIAAHGGMQGVYKHASTTCQCHMTFSVFVPPQAADKPCPVLWYLSGLTCTHANVMEKGEYRRAAAEHGIIIVCPDTSPRGEDVADDPDGAYDFGLGAGFYVDATQAPYAQHYKMYSYITQELPALIGAEFNADMSRQSIFGHSMGGHGALTIALKNPGRFKSVSAFAPIVAPSQVPWGEKAFGGYLGEDKTAWIAHDTCALIARGNGEKLHLLVDQGMADNFLEGQLKPDLLEQACAAANHPLTLRRQDGYDHSYFFISTFMEDHMRHHAAALA